MFKSLGRIFSRTKDAGTVASLNHPLTELPQTSGAGAFVAPISFEVLGATSNLLNIKLPRSSVLNLRYNHGGQKVLAMNGQVSQLYLELARLDGGKGVARDLLVYQRCFNTSSAMSILLALNSQNANYSILRPTPTASWIVRRDSLVAWSGTHLDVEIDRRLASMALVKGEGTVAVASPGQIFQVEIEEGESMLLNPRSIVGYKTSASLDEAAEELAAGTKSFVDLSLPKVGVSAKLGYYYSRTTQWFSHIYSRLKAKLAPGPPENYRSAKPAESGNPAEPESVLSAEQKQKLSQAWAAVVRTASRFGSLLTSALGRVVSGQSYMVELKGPKTVLVHNAVWLRTEVLSEKQLASLTK